MEVSRVRNLRTHLPAFDIFAHVRSAVAAQEIARKNAFASIASNFLLPKAAISIPKISPFALPNIELSVANAITRSLRLGRAWELAVARAFPHSGIELRVSLDFNKLLEDKLRSVQSIANIVNLVIPHTQLKLANNHLRLPTSASIQSMNLGRRTFKSVPDVLQSVIAVRESIKSSLERVLIHNGRNGDPFSRVFTNLDALRTRLDSLQLGKLELIQNDLQLKDAAFAAFDMEDYEVAIETVIGGILHQDPSLQPSIEDLLNRLIDWTEKQDESAIKRRMVDLLINLSASLIWFIAATVVATYFEREVTTKTESQVRIKELKRALVSITPAHSNIRIAVRTATLRSAPKKSSAIIGYINQGSIVFVVQKIKKLTQVEWMDPSSGQLLSGWISSKYLAANKQ